MLKTFASSTSLRWSGLTPLQAAQFQPQTSSQQQARLSTQWTSPRPAKTTMAKLRRRSSRRKCATLPYSGLTCASRSGCLTQTSRYPPCNRKRMYFFSFSRAKWSRPSTVENAVQTFQNAFNLKALAPPQRSSGETLESTNPLPSGDGGDGLGQRKRMASGALPDGVIPAKLIKKEPIDVSSLNAMVSGKAQHIGRADPRKDFNDMIQNPKVDLVETAIREMMKEIKDMIFSSVGTTLYRKAIDCLSALKKGCISEEEVQWFNNYMRDIKASFANHPKKKDFWALLKAERLGIITKADDDTLSIPESALDSYFQEEAPAAPAPRVPSPIPANDDDDEDFE
eukprot:Rmarinus@m.26134